MSSLQLTDLQIDALKEVGNIGAGHAATALSELLGVRIALQAPQAEIIKFADLETRVGEDRALAALMMEVHGKMPGQMVLLIDREQAADFVRMFLSRIIADVQMFDSIVESTLKEIGNIIAGSYLSAIVQLTGVDLIPSVPMLTYGTLQSVFSALVASGVEKDVFLVDSTFLHGGVKVSGHFILIPGRGSIAPLLAVFGVE